jgi:hypothetical protein
MEALGDPSAGEAEPDESTAGTAARGAAPDAVVGAETQPPAASGAEPTQPVSSAPPVVDPGARPALRLVRNTVRTLIGTREAHPAPSLAAQGGVSALPVAPAPPEAPHVRPAREPEGATPGAEVGEVVTLHPIHPRRGVCESYYVNHACWEVPTAFCNHSLHTCMLRDCPVYNLHREELERRFASKYSHLW